MLQCFHRCRTICLAYGHARIASRPILVQTLTRLQSATAHSPAFPNSTRLRAISTERRKHGESKAALPTSAKDPAAWVALLEPLLPPHLRSVESGDAQNDFRESEALSRILYLLASARNYELDLLSYLGIHFNRWPAVHWVIKCLLDDAATRVPTQQRSNLSNLDWPSVQSFDETLINPVGLPAEVGSKPRVARTMSDKYSNNPRYSGLMGPLENRDPTMEQLWPSLGSMILEAADMPESEGRNTMSHVYQIIAHLHHIGFIPDSVYTYTPATDSSALLRPPIIHLLSSRILTTLSDAVWRAHEKEVAAQAAAAGAQYTYLGHEVPGARYRLRVLELGFEVWIEFILWCCVDGGFAREGAWILSQLRKRQGDRQWGAISWTAVTDGASPSPSRASRVDWDKVKRRFGGPVGLIEGYSHDRPFVEMGSRKISGEVILALLDGLINVMRTGVAQRGIAPSEAQDRINQLSFFLHQSGIRLSIGYYNSMVIRMLEAYAIDPSIDPGALGRLLRALSPARVLSSEAKNLDVAPLKKSKAPSVDEVFANSDLVPGLLHLAMDSFAKKSDVTGAMRTYTVFQELVDTKKTESIKFFVQNMNDPSRRGEYDREQENDSVEDVSRFYGQLPVRVLARFFDLLTDSQVFDLGKWLLYSTDVDGPPISPDLYGDPSLAPALLNFAAATFDAPLMENVVEMLDIPLVPNVLRALFNCRIAFYAFDSAEDLLQYLKEANPRVGGWRLNNVMALAATLVRLEAQPNAGMDPKTVQQGQDLLHRLLKGDFNSADSYVDNYEVYNGADERRLALCIAILRSVPGRLEDTCNKIDNIAKVPHDAGMPAAAFNHLLSAIVEHRGAREGKRLWDLWCRSPKGSQDEFLIDGGIFKLMLASQMKGFDDAIVYPRQAKEREELRVKHVDPNLRTLRIIVSAALRELKATGYVPKSPQRLLEDQVWEYNEITSVAALRSLEILDWSVGIFRSFRLSDKEIIQEVEGMVYVKSRRRIDLESKASEEV